MRKRLALALLIIALLFALGCPAMAGEAASDARRRALLIGCDHFVSHADTLPAASMNVTRMARMLQSDARGYAHVVGKTNGLSSAAQLEATIQAAFAGARAGDVSVFYICTHGLYDRITGEAALVLSDGVREQTISGDWLREVLDAVPGVKVLYIDACNSGAFIGKGDWNRSLKSCFASPDYIALTSAGAREDSFLWHAVNMRGGGSYFASELCEGFESRAFDLDGDGAVTLREAYQGLLECHGASTPQCYPQESDFVLYAYDRADAYAGERPLSDVTLDASAVSLGDPTLYFSFTVRRPVAVRYQIVYHRGGMWRFDDAQIISDSQSADGVLSPGRKERSVLLSADDEEASGYVLLQVIASENDRPTVAASRIISVQPDAGDPRLVVWTRPSFNPGEGEEMAVNIAHGFPCALTVNIRDADGNLVKRLCHRRQSRPLGLPDEGSILYWDGKTADGAPAPAGGYYAEVSCAVGADTYRRNSVVFMLDN